MSRPRWNLQINWEHKVKHTTVTLNAFFALSSLPSCLCNSSSSSRSMRCTSLYNSTIQSTTNSFNYYQDLLPTPRRSESRVNKKDGYRQQNVRQRQKLISIIDYDVCILQPFWRYSTSKNGLTLKSGYGVLQGHRKRRGSIDHVWLSISPPLYL